MSVTMPTGFSDAAVAIQRVREDENQRRADTITFANLSVDDQLIDVYNDNSKAAWDNSDVVPVEPRTLHLARKLIASLPKEYQLPTVTGEPDGHVSIEWYASPRRLISVSVSPTGTLYWAALIGAEDPRGSCQFYGDAPKTLLYWIGRVCNG